MTERLSVVRGQPEWDQFLTPDGIEGLKIGEISLNIMGIDQLLMSPQFFAKLKGHEKDFLPALLERYDNVVELRKEYGQDMYGAALMMAPEFCLRLSEGLDSGLHDRLMAVERTDPDGYQARFMGEIRHFLNNQPRS